MLANSHKPASQLHDNSTEGYYFCNTISRVLKDINLCICEVIFLQICDLFSVIYCFMVQ